MGGNKHKQHREAKEQEGEHNAVAKILPPLDLLVLMPSYHAIEIEHEHPYKDCAINARKSAPHAHEKKRKKSDDHHIFHIMARGLCGDLNSSCQQYGNADHQSKVRDIGADNI